MWSTRPPHNFCPAPLSANASFFPRFVNDSRFFAHGWDEGNRNVRRGRMEKGERNEIRPDRRYGDATPRLPLFIYLFLSVPLRESGDKTIRFPAFFPYIP
jgi:hypothetical protein